MTRMVVLQGGPMSGWIVPEDAPVLREGWTAPLVRSLLVRLLRRSPAPGRYVVSDGVAVWQETRP